MYGEAEDAVIQLLSSDYGVSGTYGIAVGLLEDDAFFDDRPVPTIGSEEVLLECRHPQPLCDRGRIPLGIDRVNVRNDVCSGVLACRRHVSSVLGSSDGAAAGGEEFANCPRYHVESSLAARVRGR